MDLLHEKVFEAKVRLGHLQANELQRVCFYMFFTRLD